MRRLVLFLIAGIFLFGMGAPKDDTHPAKPGISWYSLKEAQQLASSGEKKVLVYMEASWCTYCKKMEKEVFTQEKVQDIMHKYYYPVRLDIESDKIIEFKGQELTEQEFASTVRLTGTPTFLFVTGDWEILGKQPGFMPADVFKALLSYVGTDSYNQIKFDQYLKNENID